MNLSNMGKHTFKHHENVYHSLQNNALQCPLIVLNTWLLGPNIDIRGVKVQKQIGSGCGDQNNKEKKSSHFSWSRTENWPPENIKIWKCRIIIPCDISNETFEQKTCNKSLFWKSHFYKLKSLQI